MDTWIHQIGQMDASFPLTSLGIEVQHNVRHSAGNLVPAVANLAVHKIGYAIPGTTNSDCGGNCRFYLQQGIARTGKEVEGRGNDAEGRAEAGKQEEERGTVGGG